MFQKTAIKVAKQFKFLSAIFLYLLVQTDAHSLTIYGHRGARGLMPENTIPALHRALDEGVDFVDLDVVMTKDDVLVALHDLVLNRDITRDKKGKWLKKIVVVKNINFKKLRTYDVGEIKPKTAYRALFPAQKNIKYSKIPSLRAAIRYVKNKVGNKVGFQFEIKTDPTLPNISVEPQKIVSQLVNLMEEEGITKRSKIQAYDGRCLVFLHQINPKINSALITDLDKENNMLNQDPVIAGKWTAGKLLKDHHNSIPELILALGGHSWDAEDLELTKEKVQKAHEVGLEVVAWSWPERTGKEFDLALLRKLIDMGVDGIITDRPDLIKRV